MTDRVVKVPPSLVEEALRGGFSSLWLPTEVGFVSGRKDHRVQVPAGSKDLIVGLCLHGRGWFQDPRTRHEVRAGQAWVALPGIPLAYGSDEGHPWSLYWIQATGSRISWMHKLLLGDSSVPVFSLDHPAAVPPLLNEILVILESGYSKRNLDLAALAYGHLMASLQRGRSELSPGVEAVEDRIARTMVWMEVHLQGPLNVRELAAQCNLSTSYFTSRFRQQTGKRVLEYFVALKVKKAQNLLETTRSPVKEIALSLGYTDQLYFSRTFKKHTGYSPLDWRSLGNSSSTPSS